MFIHNAAAYLPPFIGREAELSEIARIIGDPACRMLTLTGPGGIGKTRLALEAVSRQSPAPADGAWLVELASLTEPDLAAEAVAAALNLHAPGERTQAEVLATQLRDRRILLLFDNCEHLPAACAHLAQVLLAHCPGLMLVVTSRQALHVPGEVVWPVPALSLPDLAHPAASLSGSEAVRLFADRAQRASPAFALTPANAPDVAAICVHLDGLPLAIELAAPWVRVLSPAQIAARLGQRFQLLAGSDLLPARHRTLQAALDWSHDRLPPAEQVLFRRLSAFAGTFDLDAAEAIGAGGDLAADEVLSLLDHLVDKSLVTVCTDQGPALRYHLLETIHEYGRTRLRAAGEEHRVRDRHLQRYLTLAEEIRPHVWGTAGADRLGRLEVEQDNLRAALGWAVETGQGEAATRLAVALGWWWYVRAQLHEGRFWLERVLTLVESASQSLQAYAFNTTAALAALSGDYDRAAMLAGEAIRLDCDAGCTGLAAWSLHQLGLIALYEGHYTVADQLFESSLAAFRRLEDSLGIASLIMYQGLAACYLGDMPRASALLGEGLSLVRDMGDAVAEARALHGLGLVARLRGELGASRSYFEEALHVAYIRGARLELASSLDDLAGIAWLEGEPRRAARLFGAAGVLYEAAGTTLPAGVRVIRDRDAAAVCDALGEGLFVTEQAAGRMMSPDGVLTVARKRPAGITAGRRDLASAGRMLTPLQEAKRRYGGLTTRERQVASLVAQGKSNAAIAADLFLTVRTVETHLTHILAKLGFTSRAQLAVWAVDRGLAPAPRAIPGTRHLP